MNTQVRQADIAIANARPIDMKFEVAVIPVSDVERSKCFLQQAGLEARRRVHRR